MPTFKVRTYEENVDVIADTVEYCADGNRLMFKTGGRVTAGFSRYLWVQEEKAAEPVPEVPVEPEPEPEVPAQQPEPIPEPAPEAQP
jgi:hypothetical protein